MLVLSCNVGSTSLKYRLYDLASGEVELAAGHFEGIGRPVGKASQQAGAHSQSSDLPAGDYAAAIGDMLAFLTGAGLLPAKGPDCVAFRSSRSSLRCLRQSRLLLA